MTCPDCHPAYVAGLEQGRAERITAEIPDRARAMLVEWSRESRDMATEYAAKVGPNWAALIAECGESDER
jgi:hypothetical protein